jgi:phage tail protein, P2 protein I family
MIDIYTVSVLDLLPPNLKQDPDMIAASKAVDTEFTLVVNEVKNCIILPRIDELGSDLVDLLAWELHVDFYDPTLSLEVRRQIVKNSTKWHRQKGTPAAVEELIDTVFGDGQVQEWFDYAGQPYMFKVITPNASVTGDQAALFIRALDSVKNARSKLEEIIISLSGEMDLYYAGIVHTGDNLTIKQVV